MIPYKHTCKHVHAYTHVQGYVWLFAWPIATTYCLSSVSSNITLSDLIPATHTPFYVDLCQSSHDIVKKPSFYTLFPPLGYVKSWSFFHQEIPITFPGTCNMRKFHFWKSEKNTYFHSSLRITGGPLDFRTKTIISFWKILIPNKVIKHRYSNLPMEYGIALKGSSVQVTSSLAFSVCTDKWMPTGLAFSWTK